MGLFSEGGAAGETGQGGLGANPRHTRIKGGAASVGQRALGAQDLDEGGLAGLVAEAAETIGLLGGGLGLFLCDDAADGGVGLGAGRAPVGFGPQARVLEPGGGGVGAGGSGGDIVAVLVEQGNGADMLAITVVASSPFRRRTPNEAVTSGPARRRPTLAWRLAASRSARATCRAGMSDGGTPSAVAGEAARSGDWHPGSYRRPRPGRRRRARSLKRRRSARPPARPSTGGPAAWSWRCAKRRRSWRGRRSSAGWTDRPHARRVRRSRPRQAVSIASPVPIRPRP